MPMAYEIDRTHNLLTLRGEGRITDDELVCCVRRLRADPDLTLNMPALADMRGVTLADLTSTGIRTMLEVMEQTANPASTARAAILTGADASASLARLAQALSEARQTVVSVRAFTDQDEAEGWLTAS